MSIDDRDYMRDRSRVSTSTNRASWWNWVFKISFVIAVGFLLFLRFPQLSSRMTLGKAQVEFPVTGAARWFIPAVVDGFGNTAPLAIKGPTNISQNVVVKLDTWDTHTPIVIIPIRGGESAALQIPLGRYRVTYASNATWHGESKLVGEIQEGIDPIDFYRMDNQVIGHTIDLNARIDGNLKTRRTSYF